MKNTTVFKETYQKIYPLNIRPCQPRTSISPPMYLVVHFPNRPFFLPRSMPSICPFIQTSVYSIPFAHAMHPSIRPPIDLCNCPGLLHVGPTVDRLTISPIPQQSTGHARTLSPQSLPRALPASSRYNLRSGGCLCRPPCLPYDQPVHFTRVRMKSIALHPSTNHQLPSLHADLQQRLSRLCQ